MRGRFPVGARWTVIEEELSNGGYLEDPTATITEWPRSGDLLWDEGMDVPMASNVAVTCFAQVVEAEKADAVQVVLSDPHYWGGVRATAAG